MQKQPGDIDSQFEIKSAILISANNAPEFENRRRQTHMSLSRIATFNQIIDKNLTQNDSIYKLLET